MFVLAQSITLTPGTVLVRITDNEFFVHALDDDSASGLPGDMEKRSQKYLKDAHDAIVFILSINFTRINGANGVSNYCWSNRY